MKRNQCQSWFIFLQRQVVYSDTRVTQCPCISRNKITDWLINYILINSSLLEIHKQVKLRWENAKGTKIEWALQKKIFFRVFLAMNNLVIQHFRQNIFFGKIWFCMRKREVIAQRKTNPRLTSGASVLRFLVPAFQTFLNCFFHLYLFLVLWYVEESVKLNK